MRLVAGGRKQRTVYAIEETVGVNDDGSPRYEYFMSPAPEAASGRRPINRYDNKQELELEAARRGCKLVWQ